MLYLDQDKLEKEIEYIQHEKGVDCVAKKSNKKKELEGSSESGVERIEPGGRHGDNSVKGIRRQGWKRKTRK